MLPDPPADGIFWWRGLAAAADGAFAMTGDGRITLWNRAAARITGYEAHEVLGRRCCDVFVGRDVKGDRLCLASCRLLGQIKNGEPVETFAPRWIRMFRDVTASRTESGPTNRFTDIALDGAVGELGRHAPHERLSVRTARAP